MANVKTVRNLLIGLAAMILVGCDEHELMMNQGNMDRGLVIVLPGIDGRAGHNENACKVLSQEQLGMAVELYDWTSPMGALYNQTAIEHNHQQAAGLARRILQYRSQHPGRPVILIGHSGGTAIATWAAEYLPEDQKVDGIILLASSLSPTYDLTAALAHTRMGIINFYSDKDGLLGTGTSMIGTMDGQHTESAGKVSFRGAGYRYEKLYEISWQPEMARTGHDGGHFGYTAPEFVSKYIVPLVAAGDWTKNLTAQIAGGRTLEIASIK